MTDDVTPHESTDPYEDALAARFEQATAALDGGGVSRDGVQRVVAARARGQRRRRTALVGVAATVALLGGVAVAGTVGDDDTRVRTDDQADASPPCPDGPESSVAQPFSTQGVEIIPGSSTAVGSMEGYTPTFGDQEPIRLLTPAELESAATLLQVLDQVDPASYLTFVRSLSSDFTLFPERQAFAQAVRALHPYTGPNGASFPDGPQRRAIDDYAATLPAEVFIGDQAAPTPVLPGGVRCDDDGEVIVGTADTTPAVLPGGPGGPPASSTTVVVTGEAEPASGPVGTLGVEAIGVSAAILPVDREEVGATGVLLLPDSPFPGGRGNAVIAGSRRTDGEVFRRLAEVALGDELRVTLPDGEVLVFLVDVSPQPFPEQEQAQRLADLADEAEPRLTLVTYGPASPSTEGLLVSAVLSHSYLPGAADGPG